MLNLSRSPQRFPFGSREDFGARDSFLLVDNVLFFLIFDLKVFICIFLLIFLENYLILKEVCFKRNLCYNKITASQSLSFYIILMFGLTVFIFLLFSVGYLITVQSFLFIYVSIYISIYLCPYHCL